MLDAGWAWLWSRPYLLLVLTMLVWAGNTVAGRLAVGEISPMAITALRWTLVVATLFAVGRRTIVAGLPALWPHRRFVFAMGSCGFTIFNALFYVAAQHTSVINLGVIQGIVPALVMAGTVVVYRARLSGAQLAGLALAILGVVIATSHGSLEVLRHLAFNVGDLWMLMASCLYAGYTVALRGRPAAPPLVFFAAMALAALVTSLPLLGWEIASGRIIWPGLKGWLLLLYIALLPSLVSQLFFMRGVELIGPARAGLFVNLVPIFAALLGVAILGESFGSSEAVALALVLGGIGLAERGRRPAA